MRHLLLLSLVLAVPAVAQNQLATLGAAKDNTIYDLDPATGSNGAGSRFFCGTDLSSSIRRGLISFAISRTIPAGSTIVSARLDLTLAQTNSSSRACTLHRLTSSWGEAGSIASSGQGGGGFAMPGDATWDYAFWDPTTPTAWQTQGGDFNSTSSASTVVGSSGTFSWSSAQLTADVQAMLDQPGQNFGWLLKTDETVIRTARAFHTHEASLAADRPALVVTYTPPAAAVTSFGTGCTGGGASVLSLSANGLPTVPNPTFGFTLIGGPAGAVLAVNLFALPQSPPIPIGGGCDILGDFNTLLIGLVTTGVLPFQIPNNPVFYGFELTAQGVALDFSTGGIATSNGLTLLIGI